MLKTKLQLDFDNAFSEFVNNNNLTTGHVLVPLNAILKLFTEQHPTLPITSRRLGLKLTSVYYKALIAVPNKSPITGYFLNKTI